MNEHLKNIFNSQNETNVGGRIIGEDGVALKCRHCGGTRGWRQTSEGTQHTGCGKWQ